MSAGHVCCFSRADFILDKSKTEGWAQRHGSLQLISYIWPAGIRMSSMSVQGLLNTLHENVGAQNCLTKDWTFNSNNEDRAKKWEHLICCLTVFIFVLGVYDSSILIINNINILSIINIIQIHYLWWIHLPYLHIKLFNNILVFKDYKITFSLKH